MIGPIHKLTQNMQKHLHGHLEVRGSKLRGFLHTLANGSYRYVKLVQDEMASPTIAKVFQLRFTLDIPRRQFKLSIQWDFLWWKTGVWFSQAMAEKRMFISPSCCSEFYTCYTSWSHQGFWQFEYGFLSPSLCKVNLCNFSLKLLQNQGLKPVSFHG